jgi:hypothetical protein
MSAVASGSDSDTAARSEKREFHPIHSQFVVCLTCAESVSLLAPMASRHSDRHHIPRVGAVLRDAKGVVPDGV